MDKRYCKECNILLGFSNHTDYCETCFWKHNFCCRQCNNICDIKDISVKSLTCLVCYYQNYYNNNNTYESIPQNDNYFNCISCNKRKKKNYESINHPGYCRYCKPDVTGDFRFKCSDCEQTFNTKNHDSNITCDKCVEKRKKNSIVRPSHINEEEWNRRIEWKNKYPIAIMGKDLYFYCNKCIQLHSKVNEDPENSNECIFCNNKIHLYKPLPIDNNSINNNNQIKDNKENIMASPTTNNNSMNVALSKTWEMTLTEGMEGARAGTAAELTRWMVDQLREIFHENLYVQAIMGNVVGAWFARIIIPIAIYFLVSWNPSLSGPVSHEKVLKVCLYAHRGNMTFVMSPIIARLTPFIEKIGQRVNDIEPHRD